MSHSITLLELDDDVRAGEILEGLAERLDLPHLWKDRAGHVQLWLQFDPERAYDAVVTALNEASADWRAHLTVIGPYDKVPTPHEALLHSAWRDTT
jgi:hypothetical protein